jgi:crotonobetainyl-CoA:carnitine CoA-transferase CaiB-like acyl-CoA transferase
MTADIPASPPAPLKGVRVLDLSRILAGPWTAQMLADLGAEVIKIERPGSGDDTRGWGPPYAKADGDDGRGEAAYFMGANRGKKSLAIDLKSPDGAALVRKLAADSDILIENFKVGDLARYGLDPTSLHEINPRLIVCSITGFGQTGPRASQAGYDLMIQGMAGLMSITGPGDDQPGGAPTKVGVAVVDILTGLNAAIAILAALAERHRTGKGRHVDLALYDVCAASLANQAMNFLISGQSPVRMGNKHPNIAPYETYAAADGHLILAVGNDGQFRKFCQVAGLSDLPDDPDYATNSARVANRVALSAMLEPVLRGRMRDDWLEALTAVGVPCGPINTIQEVFADPHAVARGLVRDLPHATLGSVPTVSSPIRFDGDAPVSDRAAPVLGQDSADILGNVLGLSRDDIDDLVARGVVQVSS